MSRYHSDADIAKSLAFHNSLDDYFCQWHPRLWGQWR